MANTIQITLEVDDKGSAKVAKFSTNITDQVKQMSDTSAKMGGVIDKVKSMMTSLQDHWMGVTAACAAGWLVLQKALRYGEMAAKAQQAEEAFRGVAASAGENADALLAALKKASGGTIEESALMQKAVKGMTLDLSGGQIVEIMEAARVSARLTGEDVLTAYESITDAISTQMPKALKRYGLISKQEMSLVNQAMAEGITDINLHGIAMANAAIQAAKQGEIMENAAEGFQKFHASVKAVEEVVGKELIEVLKGAYSAAMLLDAGILILGAGMWKLVEARKNIRAMLTSGDTEKEYLAEAAAARENAAELMGIAEQMADGVLGSYAKQTTAAQSSSAAQVAAAQKNKKEITEDLQVRLGAVERLKQALESLRAVNKAYFKDQEDNLKTNSEIMQMAGIDSYKIEMNVIEKRTALMKEYYDRTDREITMESVARTEADRKKVSDASFVAEKMKALDADVLNRANEIARQKTLLSMKTAQEDVKNLTSRLGDYQNYYKTLEQMIQKNTEAEKKHLEELKALRRQRVDIEKSTNDLIAKLKGPDSSISAKQGYESGSTKLDEQYFAALRQSGQEKIKAMEEYKQAVATFAGAYPGGVKEVSEQFGQKVESTIVGSSTVISDAITNIERATQVQKTTLAALEEEKQKQIETDKIWGSVMQQTAQETTIKIQDLQGVIGDLSTQIEAMKKVITISGDDQVSRVVDTIAQRLNDLHDKTVYITTVYKSIGGSAGAVDMGPLVPSSGGGSSADISQDWTGYDAGDVVGYALGTPYVPRTGMYRLHEGEIVVPPEESRQIRKQSVLRGAAGAVGEDFEAASGDVEDGKFSSPRRPTGAGFNAGEAITKNYFTLNVPQQPATRESGGVSRSMKFGDIVINIPESAAPQRPEDWRAITRQFIVPELEKIGHA
jgi:hypothetical protein